MADMMNTGIGLGDAMCLAKNNFGNDANYMWNNPFFYLIFLALFGNGGFGWGNNGQAGYNLGQQTAEIQNAIYASNEAQTNALNNADNFRNVSQQINAIGDGIASATYALNNTMKDGNYAINNSITALGAGVHDGFDKIGYQLMENRFIGQQGVTAIQNAIAETNYNNAQNTCKLENAIKDSTGLILNQMNANTVQALRDKLCETNQALQSANFTISQQAQNEYLVNALGNKCCGCN